MSEELLERVRSANGPDRKLDALIWLALEEKPENGKRDNDMIGREPAYTDSIDASVKLMERCFHGCAWSVTRPHAGRKRKRKADGVKVPFDAYIANNDEVGVPGHIFALAEGPTPPLALLEALLQALSQPK